MDFVWFFIHRKAAFAGALLPYPIYINGQFTGAVKNGKTLRVKIPKAEIYYLEDNNCFERNAVVFDSSKQEYYIILKRAGGWRTESYNEFYTERDNALEQLPSFHFERYMNAIFSNSTDQLAADEQVLALCLEFCGNVADDLQEVLSSANLAETIKALQTIGATLYSDLLSQLIKEYFSDVPLPLNDKQTEELHDRLHKANQQILKNEKSAWYELRTAMVRYMREKLNNTVNIY